MEKIDVSWTTSNAEINDSKGLVEGDCLGGEPVEKRSHELEFGKIHLLRVVQTQLQLNRRSPFNFIIISFSSSKFQLSHLHIRTLCSIYYYHLTPSWILKTRWFRVLWAVHFFFFNIELETVKPKHFFIFFIKLSWLKDYNLAQWLVWGYDLRWA